MAALTTLQKYTKVIFANSSTQEWRTLPTNVQAALASKDLGRFIPRTVVMSNDFSTCIVKIKYEDWKQKTQATKKIKDHLEGYNKSQQQMKNEELKKFRSIMANRALHTLKNTEGKTVEAKLVTYSESKITLQTENGKIVKYPFHKLSQESKDLLKSLSETYTKSSTE